MGTIYEVTSTYSLILSAITGYANLLSIANKGTKLDILEYNKTDLWSYLKLNNTDAYILKSDLKLITGSVTIKYIDKDTNTELATSESFTNISLGSYTYNAKTISGYSIYGDNEKAVTLTADNPNIIVTFTYIKILGTIYLKYLDDTSLEEIKTTETFNNLELKSYSYTATSIDNYTLSNESSQTVILTDSTPIQTITFRYKKILGSVTVNYLENNSLKVISIAKVYNNLEMGPHSFNAINIKNYTLVSPYSQSVILTSSNLNQSITFKYKKTSGKVTIKYIDKPTQIEIATEDIIENLSMGSYTYNAKTVVGYSVLGDSSKTITLTEESPSASITFEYDIVYLPLDVNKQNEVPYISTYYIKPVVEPGEEVFIDYYITDYYYKEYLEEDYSENFTVTVRVEGQADKVFRNMKAGDHKVSLGSFTNLGNQKFSILCTDAYGRNSHELFNFFLIRKPIVWNEYVMTQEDLNIYNIKNTDNYEVKKIIDLSTLSSKTSATVKAALVDAANKITPDSKTYVCVIADTTGDGTPDNWWAENQVKYASDYDKTAVLQEATNTRIGLQQLLDVKKADGYNKVKLLPGIYRIDHQKQIYIPTQFTLDMNGSILKQNQFTGNKSLMIDLNNTFDSHVINGTVEGDYFTHDYTNSTNNSEWVNGINIGSESKYSSFDNINIKDITGYGGGNGIAVSRDNTLNYTYLYPKSIGNTFKLEDIDRKTGLNISPINRTTSDYIDITGYSSIGYLSVSVYLGYQGNPCGTWNIICHFYDENKIFIQSIDSYQYRRVSVPSNARYLRVTILNESYPTNLSVQYFRIPTHCSFNNVNFENCRCVGLAQAAMKDMLVDSCKFTRNGQSSAKCAYDAEDGWDMMQDCTFKNNNFYNNPNNDFLTCAGHNFIVDGQKSGKIYIWERTRSIVIKNCSNTNITLQSGGVSSIVQHGIYKVFNNIFISGSVANNLSKNNTCIGSLSGIVSNSTLGSLADFSTYNNCIIKISSTLLAYLNSIKMINCSLIPESTLTSRYSLSFNNGHLDSYYFENCNFCGKSKLNNHNGFFSGKFVNCNFEDTAIFPNVQCEANDIIYFEDCTLNYSENNFIYYSPFAYSKGTNTNIQFNNCTINNIDNNNKSLIYAYAKPNGICVFTNCIINIPDNLIIFDGISFYKDYIESYIVKFLNSPIKNNNILISDLYKSNTNIQVIIN
ncbi:MucBP domain-containing protein [Clostridium sp. D53t1_180928_C8]|uniref:MucBP domain-containing protein n=1 Tax=Clostridium sp. D53t1_180928_C8 TaxID=2787101 RepID=UPI0018AA69F9|nr:MucBP domain-containing protein [Clostridium sp. D53t1_180928_C8]